MPRQTHIRNYKANTVYHIYNRGNYKNLIFYNRMDYYVFRKQLLKHILEYNLYILGYCFMPNHFHLVVKTGESPEDLSRFMHKFMLKYVMYFNRKYGLIGRLFQSRYNSKAFYDEESIKKLLKYVKNNPVEASLVRDSSMYKWMEILV
jgi:putative transposase